VKKVFALAFVACLSGCGTIEHTSYIEQPTGQVRLAGIGDVVLRVNKQRNLENIAGKADMWGRKTNEGFSELRFAGIETTGEVVLYRKDVQIISNETTMSRTPLSFNSAQATTRVTGGVGNARANTSVTGVTVSGASDFHVVIPPDTTPIRLAVGETKLPMEGYIVEVVKAGANSLEYKITKN
jgi:curli biogenesis system outer membrane secretion channel CsgG